MDIGLTWNNAVGYADIAVVDGDLGIDLGLTTAVIISLFTDAQAQPGDIVLDASGDKRGWWGDSYEPQPASGVIDFTGSRLWLITERGVIVNDTLLEMQDHATNALAWMIDDGIAASISATASAFGITGIGLAIEIDQGTTVSAFDFAWSNS